MTTDPGQLHAVRVALEGRGIQPGTAELTWIPRNTVSVAGEEAQKLLKLLEALEDLDDVQKVDANFDMDVSELAEA